MTTNDKDCRPEFEAWLATCGKSPLMWNTSDAMLAAWAAATRAALATQPAAGEPEQQTAINADDLPTKKYPLGALDFDAPVAASEPVAPKLMGYVSKHAIEDLAKGSICTITPDKMLDDGQDWEVPVYATPPAAAHGDEAVRKDAERYRWLRSNCEEGDLCIARSDGFSLRSVSGDDPDRYIDAMRAQAGEGGE
jgi:hypothetical protein